MKPISYSGHNRPVHLARRDVYFERAEKLIFAQQQTYLSKIRTEEYEEILFLLRVARQHADFAIRANGGNGKDEQFARFINLLAGNVKAILSMLNLKNVVEHSDGSIVDFLGGNQASVALQAEEYQRRANDIVRSIHNTLRLAEEPFNQLKKENTAASGKEETARYKKARKHVVQLFKEGRHRYKIAPSMSKRTGA